MSKKNESHFGMLYVTRVNDADGWAENLAGHTCGRVRWMSRMCACVMSHVHMTKITDKDKWAETRVRVLCVVFSFRFSLILVLVQSRLWMTQITDKDTWAETRELCVVFSFNSSLRFSFRFSLSFSFSFSFSFGSVALVNDTEIWAQMNYTEIWAQTRFRLPCAVFL